MTLRKPLAARLAPFLLAALLTTAGPLAAAEVFVPVLDPNAVPGGSSQTELWVTNTGTASANIATIFLPERSNGTQRSGQATNRAVAAGRSINVTGLGQAAQTGLLAIDLPAGVVVDARLVSTAGSTITITDVPVISEANRFAAGARAELVGLERIPEQNRLIHFALVNLGTQSTQCDLRFHRADASPIGSSILLSLPPLSLDFFADALGTLSELKINGVRSSVTCNQPFYVFAVLAGAPNTHASFVTPAASAASSGGGGGGGGTPPPSGKTYVFERKGLIHSATTSMPKGVVGVNVPGALSLRRLVLDMDFVPGPWNLEKIPGNHAVVWLYRGKFRSNTVANVNAFGPDKFTLKMNQNVDLSPPSNTNAEGAVSWVKGQKYHLNYVYDAEAGVVTAKLSTGGTVVRTISMASSASGKTLTVPAAGMIAEFGHYFNQAHGPEVASPGWTYSDLRVEMVSY